MHFLGSYQPCKVTIQYYLQLMQFWWILTSWCKHSALYQCPSQHRTLSYMYITAWEGLVTNILFPKQRTTTTHLEKKHLLATLEDFNLLPYILSSIGRANKDWGKCFGCEASVTTTVNGMIYTHPLGWLVWAGHQNFLFSWQVDKSKTFWWYMYFRSDRYSTVYTLASCKGAFILGRKKQMLSFHW